MPVSGRCGIAKHGEAVQAASVVSPSMTDSMNLILIAKALVLLAVANGAPVLAKKLAGTRWAAPIDGGLRLGDGNALFGPSKTYRGLLASFAATTAAAPLIGLDWWLGLLAAGAAMAGDLGSSFVKRRLGYRPSSMAPGLDHIPESLLPTLVIAAFADLAIADTVAIVCLFWGGALVLSRLLFRVGLRDQPH
jgi:CDP-2,3-bis-(O-geranylgeranyl)-sn-glycerol synthase